MPIPSKIPNPRTEPGWALRVCELAESWQVEPILLHKIALAQAELPFDLHLFSGARTRAHQERISSTPFDISTHANEDAMGCPRLATGVDVQPALPGVRVIDSAAAQMGAAFVHQGLRWGGGADVEETGIPEGNERWHVDLGPRHAT